MSESYVTHNECARTTENLSEQVRELQKEVFKFKRADVRAVRG